jgi:curved DNA-binding protein CbpA
MAPVSFAEACAVFGLPAVPTVPSVYAAEYRKLCLKLHPDKGGSKEDFQRLQQAKEVIEARLKRKLVDDVVRCSCGQPLTPDRTCADCDKPCACGKAKPSGKAACFACEWREVAPCCTVCLASKVAGPDMDVCVGCDNDHAPRCLHCNVRQVPRAGDTCRACEAQFKAQVPETERERVSAWTQMAADVDASREALKGDASLEQVEAHWGLLGAALKSARRFLADLPAMSRHLLDDGQEASMRAQVARWTREKSAMSTRLNRMRPKESRQCAAAPAELRKKREALLKRRARAKPEQLAGIEAELRELDLDLAGHRAAVATERIAEASSAADDLQAAQKRRAEELAEVEARFQKASDQAFKKLRTAHAAASSSLA